MGQRRAASEQGWTYRGILKLSVHAAQTKRTETEGWGGLDAKASVTLKQIKPNPFQYFGYNVASSETIKKTDRR